MTFVRLGETDLLFTNNKLSWMRRTFPKLSSPMLCFLGGLTLVIVAALTYMLWWPPLSNWVDATLTSQASDGVDEPPHDPATTAATSADSPSLILTPQAIKNLGLTGEYLRGMKLSTYRRSITVPAVIVPKPGRSQVVISSPLNGVVTHVHAVTGQAVMPGELLMEVRLTYEELVDRQTEYLKTLSELEVEMREINRLEDATRTGAVSGKSLLERRYAKDKLEAVLRSQREALRMHGLSDRQVEQIGTTGRLLQKLQVVAPDIDRHDHDEDGELELRLSQVVAWPASYALSQNDAANLPSSIDSSGSPNHSDHEHRPLVVEDLRVHKGQAVVEGDKLCSLSDYSQLYIEGRAFENDMTAINEAISQGWSINAIFSGARGTEIVRDLKLAFVANGIDPISRTLSVFVELPNEVIRDDTTAEGIRYLDWKYRLGQRLELQVPVEEWQNQMVVPVDAIVRDGADWFVFKQNGKQFERVAVHLLHRDQNDAVIANDGALFPGDVIAMRSAHQMQMAIKNQSGGAVDPHAGHNH
ncbi:efflux RND transporter periplasmic adaptor subunit [Novipirellula aureliae]|nr:efflux RND transporter periplasmic adaptor subunit [Novipirellula aureliae]